MSQATHTDSLESTQVLEPRVYEFSYLLVPTVSEEDLEKQYDSFKETIARYKGLHIASEAPVLIDLAYDMVKVIDNKNYKFSQAYFGWIKFDVMPDALHALQEELERIPNLIRSLLIKTVRENTVFSKKLVYKSTHRPVDDTEDSTFSAVESEEEAAPSIMNIDLAPEDVEAKPEGDTMEALPQ